MWLYRKRRHDLNEEERGKLDELFDRIPELEFGYDFREDVAEIFDTATDREEADRRLSELRELEMAAEFAPFFETYDRWKDGILAYFDRRETSGVVEGINNKARVITKRSYGIKTAAGLWNRLLLDLNRTVSIVHYTVQEMRAIARGIRTEFSGFYT